MKHIMLMVLFLVPLFATRYDIQYTGITLGEIESINTLSKDYLKAKVTNPIVKFMLGQDYYILYDGKKPLIEKAKFKQDNKKILFALKEAIKSKPKNRNYIIDDKRNITLSCKSNQICEFNYFSSNKHKAKGIITFDQNGNFYKLEEKKSTLSVVRSSK
jgi:hypothetical protein